MNSNTCAVVVTYNRLELLKECLNALNQQSMPIEHIVVVNNASNDGTKNFLSGLENDKVIVYNSSENLGGAFGFSKGIEIAFEKTNDSYLWLMDDDTIVDNQCNEQFITTAKKIHDEFSFFITNVRWLDGSPTNVMGTSVDWPDKIDEGLVRVDYGSFVSFFLKRSSVEQVGLPISEFFIWGDDGEYTQRLNQTNPGYFVINAKAVHKSKTNSVDLNIINDSIDRVPRYFYFYRNEMYQLKHYFPDIYKKVFLKELLRAIVIPLRASNNRWKRTLVMLKGLFFSLYFNPEIKYVAQTKK